MRILILLASLLFINMENNWTIESLRSNKDYALFFAISDYDNGLTDLAQPIENAENIASVLTQKYGFSTEIVTNPTLAQIRNKLNEYRQKYISGEMPSDGQLFISFSGHGVKEYGAGYFLPSDANPDDVLDKGLSYDSWRGFINDINCKHILVAIDACYSVTFDPNWDSKGSSDSRFARRGELSEVGRIEANHKLFASRLFFTSDSQEDVTPGRSNFARKILEGLANHQGTDPFISAEELFASYVKKAQPTPNVGDFGKDDPRSSFLFFHHKANDLKDIQADRAAFQEAEQLNTTTAYQQYILNYPRGDFRSLAEQKLSAFDVEETELIAWQYAKTANTHKAYDDFIREHPNSLYKEVVELNKSYLPGSSNLNSTDAKDELVLVKGGTFQMGRNSVIPYEKPVHSVTIPTFYMAKYEVTQKQWKKVMGEDPEELYNKNCDDCPVEGIGGKEIQEFLMRLNTQTGRNYRLPSEAEWEYAARGGQESKGFMYSGSDKIEEVGWAYYSIKDNTFGEQKTTFPVGTKAPNELGLYDMSGNVSEACEDDWHNNYNNAPKDEKAWMESPRYDTRVSRGGNYEDLTYNCAVYKRSYWTPKHHKLRWTGLRLAHSL